MATTKTLKPTNVTISIPEFTDQPDQRVNSNCIDKEADAINALSEQMGYLKLTNLGVLSDHKTATITASATASALIFITGIAASVSGAWMVLFRTGSNANNVVTLSTIGQYLTMTAGTGLSLTIANTSSQNVNVNVINIGANAVTYSMTQA